MSTEHSRFNLYMAYTVFIPVFMQIKKKKKKAFDRRFLFFMLRETWGGDGIE